MNKEVLNTGVQDFIQKNLEYDISTVLLKMPDFSGVSRLDVAQQLESKKKSKKKLPTWYKTPGIYYPKKLSIEQASSEITAHYKASLVSGKTLIDLTGGMGVDSYFFSKKMDTVFHCEKDMELSDIASHNFSVLSGGNIKSVRGDGLAFLISSPQKFDWIYLDPSRRNPQSKKVFYLRDCLPNVPEIVHTLFSKSNNILIKTSPLLDLTKGLAELSNVKEIHVVAVKNEVKELLWVLQKGFDRQVLIKTVNMIHEHQRQAFDFTRDEEKNTRITPGQPETYLYEPNAALLKAGAFTLVSARFKVKKLHRHTHLYTSDTLIEFPGRKFRILAVFPYKKSAFKAFPKKANISTRNFKESVTGLRKKLKIKEGGNYFLFFTTDSENRKIVILCEKAL